jgi:O-antigen/teichoic acid export membrane protein
VTETTGVPQRSLFTRILVNTMSGAGRSIATSAIGFLLTPIIILNLGLLQYGLWAIVGSLTGYLGLLDFGLGGAFVKFITEFVETENKAAARQVVVFGMLFYLGFGLVLATPVLVLAPYIVHLFKMPPAQYPEATSLMRTFFCLIVVAWIAGVPGMVLVAMHRMDLASRNDFIGYVVYAGTTLAFLKLHYGIAALVIGVSAQIAVAASLQILTASRMFGTMWHNPMTIERAILKRLFGFGGWTQLNSLFSIINLDAGRFIAASVASVASVSLYEIGSKLAFFAKIYPSYMLSALLPAAASADAQNDSAALDRMYAKGTRYSVFATFACAGFVIGGADPMVRVWLGKAYPSIAEIVFWITLGYAANALTGVGTTILRASGKPRYETYYTAVAMIANIVFTIPLALKFGIVGVAMGTCAGWFAGTLYFLYTYHSVRHAPWLASIGAPLARLTLASVVSTGAYYYVLHIPAVAHYFEYRALGLAVLLAISAVYGALFVGLSIALGVWVHDGPDLLVRLGYLRDGIRRKFASPGAEKPA